MKKNVHILITGASGFIGNHLIERGLENGYQVYALVRTSSKIIKHADVKYLFADITDFNELKTVFKLLVKENVALDYIIHAAALTRSNSKKEIEEVNYKGTFNLYKCLEELECKPKKLLLISSIAACGPAKTNEYISVMHSNPVTTYGKSKLKAEEYALNESNIPTIIIRPTAVYGPGDKDLYSIFKLIQGNFSPILGSHPQQLTFIYVKDLVEIIYSAVINGKKNEIFFVTDGKIYDKHELPDAIAKSMDKTPVTIIFPLFVVRFFSFCSHYIGMITGKTSSLNMEKYKELIAESWMCNVHYTFEKLNYQPKYDIKKGISETTEWYKRNNWLKK